MARILVIDDDNHVRSFVRMALERAGHQVLEAANGAEGIKLYRQQQADLFLCDLFMPEKDGLETIRELRRECADAKIVAISGGPHAGLLSHGCPADATDFLPFAKKFGAARVLQKPFKMAALLEAVQEVLDH